MSSKVATIFDHLSNITEKKTPWEKLSEADQKSFSPYIINRWLSMSYDLIEFVDMFQQYTIGPLDRKHVYQLYLDILPKKKIYAKYIKSKKSDKYENELVTFIAEHFQVSEKDAEEYINIWFELDNGKELESVLKLYGKTDAEIKKLLK